MKIEIFCYLAFIAIYVIIFVFERITGKAIFARIVEIKPVMAAIRSMAEAVAGVYQSPKTDMAYTITNAAVEAAKKAEDLWKVGEIAKDQRAGYCRDLLIATLREQGISVDEQAEQIMTGAIALACMLMPHANDPQSEGAPVVDEPDPEISEITPRVPPEPQPYVSQSL